MKLVFKNNNGEVLCKSKRVYVPASKGKKAYWRNDPRTKKAEQKAEKKEKGANPEGKGKLPSFDKLNKELGRAEEKFESYIEAKGQVAKKYGVTPSQIEKYLASDPKEKADAAAGKLWKKAHDTYGKLGSEEKKTINTLASLSIVDDDGEFVNYDKDSVMEKFGSEEKWKQWFDSNIKPLGKKVGGESVLNKIIGISSESGE